MTNHSSNHFNKYFFYYLLFLTISSVFFISENYLLHTNNIQFVKVELKIKNEDKLINFIKSNI